MAIDSNVAFVNTNTVAFPDNEGVNATGPAATDGTEFVKVMVDNYMFGPQQALLNYAGLIPDGIPEADGASQELEAMQKSFGHPGELVSWMGSTDPAVLGIRTILLHGQGVLVADYQELTDAVYIGDGNNATAESFFKADDAAGTIRNIAGIYLILPDARGLGIRGLDDTGLIDVDGAGRLPGSSQDDAFQGHEHTTFDMKFQSPGVTNSTHSEYYKSGTVPTVGIVTDGSNGTPRISSETRMKNISANIAIRY